MPTSTCHRLLTVALLAALLAGPARADEADALVERLLQAVGGRAAWADVKRLVNRSQQNRLTEPTVVEATIHIDFERPRVRIDTIGPGLVLARAFDGSTHWRRSRSGAIEPMPDATLAEDRRWYAAHVYRTLHRLAARDAALQSSSPRPGRLEVMEGGRRLAWFDLDARGEPFAFGAHDDDQGALSGPWLPQPAGIHHPAWVARRDGSWRALLQQVQVNTPFGEALFARALSP